MSSDDAPGDVVEPSPPAAGPRTPGRAWLMRVAIEVALVSVGVFLALMGDQWREQARNRELAQGSLRRFRAEVVANRQAVEKVKDYHVKVLANLQAHMASPPSDRPRVELRGIQPVFFETTAWDLALATQSLTHLDQTIAFDLSRVYGLQRVYADQTRAILQAIYLRPLEESFEGMTYYYGDLVLWEPQLLRMYDELLPKIDAVLDTAARERAR